MNTVDIEVAFNDLINELEKIKHLNEIAELHKENTEIINLKLKEYYKFSKDKELEIFKNLDNLLLNITSKNQELESSLNEWKEISTKELQNNYDYIISSCKNELNRSTEILQKTNRELLIKSNQITDKQAQYHEIIANSVELQKKEILNVLNSNINKIEKKLESNISELNNNNQTLSEQINSNSSSISEIIIKELKQNEKNYSQNSINISNQLNNTLSNLNKLDKKTTLLQVIFIVATLILLILNLFNQ